MIKNVFLKIVYLFSGSKRSMVILLIPETYFRSVLCAKRRRHNNPLSCTNRYPYDLVLCTGHHDKYYVSVCQYFSSTTQMRDISFPPCKYLTSPVSRVCGFRDLCGVYYEQFAYSIKLTPYI